MRRRYFIRDREIIVTEVPVIVAAEVRVDDRGRPLVDLGSHGLCAASTLQDAGAIFPPSVQAAFERANWVFLHPGEALEQAMDTHRLPPAFEDIGCAVIRSDRSLAIVTRTILVQVAAALSSAKARAAIEALGAMVCHPLSHAPNLFLARADGWRDAMEASEELQRDDRIVSAEPQMIEFMGAAVQPSAIRHREICEPCAPDPDGFEALVTAQARAAADDAAIGLPDGRFPAVGRMGPPPTLTGK